MNITHQDIQYDGGAFHKELDQGKTFGKISITQTRLEFDSQDTRTALSLSGLIVKPGGAGNQMLFFTHADAPGWTIFSSDHSMLKNSHLISNEAIVSQIAQIQTAKKHSHIFLIAFVLFCLAGIYGLFQLKEPLVIAAAKRVPVSWEQKLGNAVFHQLKADKHFIEDPKCLDMLDKISIPVLSRIPQKNYAFTVHIISDPSINAFALPGGHIVFNTGLLLAADSPEEIAGVLAHEAAHITLKHGLRQLIGSAGIYAVVQTFFGDTTGLMAVIAQNGAFLLTQKYSREYEQEADDKGWQYLVNANINPQGMTDFFKKLREHGKNKALHQLEDSLNFLSTHPTTQERIEYLQEKSKHLDPKEKYISFQINFKEFQALLNQP